MGYEMNSLRNRLIANVADNLMRSQLDAAAQLARDREAAHMASATGTHNEVETSTTGTNTASPPRAEHRSRAQRRLDKKRAARNTARNHRDIERQFRAYEAKRASGGKPETALEAAFEMAIAQAEAGKAQEHGHAESHEA